MLNLGMFQGHRVVTQGIHALLIYSLITFSAPAPLKSLEYLAPASPSVQPLIDPVEVIMTQDENLRNTSEEALFSNRTTEQLLQMAEQLESFRQSTNNLYEKSRAAALLYGLFRHYLQLQEDVPGPGLIPMEGLIAVDNYRYEEGLDHFYAALREDGPSKAITSALGRTYYDLAFHTLRQQVDQSIEAYPANTWMFDRAGILQEYETRIHVLGAFKQPAEDGQLPVLVQRSPVRIEWTSSFASDIFFLAMDRPEWARVINISANLGVHGRDEQTRPPINAFVRLVDKPVIRLNSHDLGESKDVTSLDELFNFRNDNLSLLKAAVVASGVVPYALRPVKGQPSPITFEELLEKLTGKKGMGFELVTRVNDIPKGSGLAVSTMLSATAIGALMKFSGQTEETENIHSFTQRDKEVTMARTILNEYLGGSGGGWQDAGGLWEGIKEIVAQAAQEGDVEHNVSRGRLLPKVTPMDLSPEIVKVIESSLVVVHGGAAQNVGDVLRDVTLAYLLRSAKEWDARLSTEQLYDKIAAAIRAGEIQRLAEYEEEDWGNRTTIAPLADNAYIETINRRLKEEMGDALWSVGDSTGARGGAGHVYLIDPDHRERFKEVYLKVARQVREEMKDGFPVDFDPVVYDVTINTTGTELSLLTSSEMNEEMPPAPAADQAAAAVSLRESQEAVDRMMDELMFDREGFAATQERYRLGEIGLERNRRLELEDVSSAEIDHFDPNQVLSVEEEEEVSRSIDGGEWFRLGWWGGRSTRFGGDIARIAYPLFKIRGHWYTVAELNAAENLSARRNLGRAGELADIPFMGITSSSTTEAARRLARRKRNFGLGARGLYVVPGHANLGLRAVPTARDLGYEDSLKSPEPTEILARHRQNELDSWTRWAREQGEASVFVPPSGDMEDQVVPAGHLYVFASLILSGELGHLFVDHPNARYFDGSNQENFSSLFDPRMIAKFLRARKEGKALMAEVTPKTADDQGGVLGKDQHGRLRLAEASMLKNPEDEFRMSYFNTNTLWGDIDAVLEQFFGISRQDAIAIYQNSQGEQARAAIGRVRQSLVETDILVTLKRVRQVDPRTGLAVGFPVAQFETPLLVMTEKLSTHFVDVPRGRYSQMKHVGHRRPQVKDGLHDQINNTTLFPNEWEDELNGRNGVPSAEDYL
ncbi:MAG: UTP--glucose-1-phosphate uridylyltransferase [Candidatus Omnitrophica bacterium]|nr:UTP--glucose-1-phosphate uridylyltransferase [Candidatus Omnitrophota bacterium]